MRSRLQSWVVSLVLCVGISAVFAGSAGAQAEIGLIRGNPLTIQTNADGSLQVWHKLYTQGASFGTAGSGFYIAANQVIFGPYYTQMELVEQKATEGRGTNADPFRSTTHFRIRDASTSLDLAQTALYVNGSPSFQLQWSIVNTGNASICLKAYHATDLYFADDDYGIGYYNKRTGSIGGYNQAKDWFMVFTPLDPATHYEETSYYTIWERVQRQQDLTDSFSSEYIDNGAALQWDVCLAAGQSKTVSDVWSFGESEGAIIAAAEQAANGGTTDAFGGGAQGPLGISAPRFREVAPGSPALTTSIPTPLDINLEPKVVGINFLWAALATLLFTAASEILNRTMSEFEAFFQRLLRPIKSISSWSNKIGLAERLGRPHWYEWVKLTIVMLLYGLIFSTLDLTWKPFTFNGIWLFITMAIAFGVVGLADDITEWNTARRWQVPARIAINPGNLMLAVFSAVFSRTLVLTPGVMFGSPEAFEIDENALDNKRKNRLMMLTAVVLLTILLVSWLPTALCALILNAGATLSEKVRPFLLIPVAALQSLLLLIFAVTVQNLFLQMLALPNTIGETIKRKSRILWLGAMLLASFGYLQMLLNPNGDLIRSLQTSNIRVFIVTIAIFLLFTILARFLLKRWQTKTAAKDAEALAVPVPSVGGSAPTAGVQAGIPSEQTGFTGQPSSTPTMALSSPATFAVLPLSEGEVTASTQSIMPAGGQAIGTPAEFTSYEAPLPVREMDRDIQGLLSGWKNSTQEQRAAYLQRVATHGQPAVQVLVGFLHNPDPAVRLASVAAVGSLGDGSCLSAVQPLLSDSDPGVNFTAQWAMGVLGNRNST